MGSAVGDWVIAGPVDVRQKYRIYTILGGKKKNRSDISICSFYYYYYYFNFLKE
jgi:hypothetical protein